MYQIGGRAWTSQKKAVAMFEFTDEDTPMQNNLPREVGHMGTEGGSQTWTSPSALLASLKSPGQRRLKALWVRPRGPKSPKQASLRRHV